MAENQLRKLMSEIRDAADKLELYRMGNYAATLRTWANTLESISISLAHRDELARDLARQIGR